MKAGIRIAVIVILVIHCLQQAAAQKINRASLVQRHNVVVTKADPLSSLTVGNGRFAFTVDVTGMQSFPEAYAKGVSLGTQSEWGWHSFIDTSGFKREEARKTYRLNGRNVTYTVQWNTPERNKAAANWFRQNPHRLQLGNWGLRILKSDGTEAAIADLKNIRQELNLWTGLITSRFKVEEYPVELVTVGHATKDQVAVQIRSALLAKGRLQLRLRFPYPTGAWTDEGTNYVTGHHQSSIRQQDNSGAIVQHQLDTTVYAVSFSWKGPGSISQNQPHQFLITPSTGSDVFECSAHFVQNSRREPSSFEEVRQSSVSGWKNYWSSGAAIDFSGSTDPRAKELERRVVLSQYLMKVQEAGDHPPQETGLTYNSWFGKPHLEMTWWHATHYALWGRSGYLEQLMDWYAAVAPAAEKIASRQGYSGLRWQKMTDPLGQEAPSSVGAFLIWQQPHYIYFAELLYREKASREVMDKYKDLVFATADFMASFAHYDSARKRFILGKGLIPAQERFKAEETFNPGYELVYWNWALNVANEWRRRSGMPINPRWSTVVKDLSPLPVLDSVYLPAESASDAYTNPEYRTDHPSILAAWGVMPRTGQVDPRRMKATFNWIWNNWAWNDTWGWDFPMTAMTATRLGDPERAVASLLMPIQTNTYLPNGHNFQDDRLRVYMPGNGGLLTAIAMMVAGYDGAKEPLPGIPRNGKWKVRWEGLKRMP